MKKSTTWIIILVIIVGLIIVGLIVNNLFSVNHKVNAGMTVFFSCVQNCPESAGNIEENCLTKCKTSATAKYPVLGTIPPTSIGSYLSDNNMIKNSCLDGCSGAYACSQRCFQSS